MSIVSRDTLKSGDVVKYTFTRASRMSRIPGKGKPPITVTYTGIFERFVNMYKPTDDPVCIVQFEEGLTRRLCLSQLTTADSSPLGLSFALAKPGYRAYDLLFGDCRILEVHEERVEVEFSNVPVTTKLYLLDGREKETDLIPLLYWTKPTIIEFNRPKQRVLRRHEVVVIEYADGTWALIDVPVKPGQQPLQGVPGILTYEIEE